MFHKVIFLVLVIVSVLSGDNFEGKGSIRGLVTDSTNGEAVIYANVVVKGTTLGSPSNNKGYYFIPSVPSGKYILIITHLNYRSKEIEVEVKEGIINEYDVVLYPKEVELEDISVVGEKIIRPTETDLGLEKISMREIDLMPSGLESDIFRVLQSTSGVSSTGDVTSQYYVRGGGGDQNLVLLNGATIYNPFHALGIFSVIDPEMISGMEFYKGGFSSDYGGRLSSILNILTRDGNKKSYHASANGGLISGKFSAEGPIPNGSFIVTGRKSYYTSLLKKYIGKEAPFNFYDASVKVNYTDPDFLEGGKYLFYAFISRDEVLNENPFVEDFTVNNNVYGLSWNKVWGSPLFSTFNISYSGYGAELLPELSKSRPKKNSISDVTTDFNFTYMYDNKDELAFGVQNKYIKTNLKMQNLRDFRIDYNQDGMDMNAYGNYKFYRWESFGLELGLRAKFVALSDNRPFIFEPRIGFNYRPNALYSFKFSFGRYSQEITALSNENELISVFQPWIVTPEKIKSPESTQISAGLTAYLTENLTIETETYYKYITNLYDINEKKYSAAFSDFVNVDGEAYGVEMLVKYQKSSVFIKSSYSLSWAFKFADGKRYTPRYDVRHSGNILLGASLGSGWEASATWGIKSGMPFTPITGFYDRPPIENVWQLSYLFQSFEAVVDWGDRNSHRLPFYHRLDLSLSKTFKLGVIDFSTGVSVINVYNRKNIYYFNRDTGERVYMLPFLPSFYVQAAI
jgi:hypothetical protein